MGDHPDHDAWMETVAHRVEFIELLDARGPLSPRDVVDALDYSRSTVTRALRELREADIVEKSTDGYTTTLAGAMAADEFRRYETASKAIRSSRDLLAPIPDAHAPPVELLTNADMILAETEVPVRALEAIADRVQGAETVRAYLPTLVNPHLLRVWHRAVVATPVDGEAIFDPDLLTVLKGQYPHLLAEMAGADGFAAYSTTGPPYGVVLTTTDDTTAVALVVYESDTALRGVIANDSAPAVEWARAELDRLGADASEVTADLDALSAAVADGITPLPHANSGSGGDPFDGDDAAGAVGHALPIDLEAEGFVHLSAEYFDAHGQADPALSWRTGFTLAEVHAGHALDRRDAEGRSLTSHLVEVLAAGDDHVVLGPPGSGKSTVCMAAACEWYDRGLGPVLYRERGNGDHLASTALLEAYLRGTDSHALVVVEDAVGEEANAVFEVMRTLDADESVTFLLDARTHEWHNPETADIGPRLERYRRSAVEEVVVPDLDERECERFVNHFTTLVGDDLDLSGPELFDMVREGTKGGREDTLPAGDALIVQHYLSRRIDTPVDAEPSAVTALDGAVHRTYRQLTDAEAELAADLGVLVAVLTAAGVPLAREYCYAIADVDEFEAVDEAISFLEGRLLFEEPRPRAAGPTPFRSRHELWAIRFLEAFRRIESIRDARDRFGRTVTRLLALADDPERREQIRHHLGGRTPHLHQIEADPQHWAEELVTRVFGIGRTDASLAPLYGETSDDAIQLPAACSGWIRLQRVYWRGRMNLIYGDLNQAEREFTTLGELAETVELDASTAVPTTPEFTSGSGDGDEDVSSHRIRWQATSRANLGTVLRDRGEYEAAEEHLKAALERFGEIDDREGAAVCLKDLGLVAYHRSDYERAQEYAERSLSIAREIGAQAIESATLDYLGVIVKDRGEYDRARKYQEQSLAINSDLGSRHGNAMSYATLGMVAEERGAYDRAREYHERALAAFREAGARHEEATCLNNIGVVARKQGAYDRAREFHERSLDIFRDLGTRHAEGACLKNLGIVARKLGGLDEAREYHERSLDINRDLGDRQRIALARRNLAIVARLEGEYDQAANHLDRALAALETIDDRHGLGTVRLEQGRLALAEDEIDTARERVRQARETFEALGTRHWIGRSRLLLGRVVAAAGASDDAREHWRAALETFETVGAPQDALATLEKLVETCLTEGDEKQAREWCQQARDIVADAPDPTAAQHRNWVERYVSELEE